MQETKSKKFLKILGYVFSAIFVMLCLVVIFFNVTHEYHVISGPSMTPTLNNNETVDGVFISKIKGYGRGDIVIVNKGEKDEFGNDILVIKRIIALAGDKITIKEINGEYRVVLIYYGQSEQTVLEEPYIDGYAQNEMLFNKFNTMITTKGYTLDDNGFFEIPEAEVFYLGDNRTISQDSSTYGTKKQSAIIGVVDYIIYGNAHPYWQVLQQVFGGGVWK